MAGQAPSFPGMPPGAMPAGFDMSALQNVLNVSLITGFNAPCHLVGFLICANTKWRTMRSLLACAGSRTVVLHFSGVRICIVHLCFHAPLSAFAMPRWQGMDKDQRMITGT